MSDSKRIVGWKEWVGLPELGVNALEVKVDTGAKTSALHTFELEPIETATGLQVKFGLHPDRHSTESVLYCQARVVDQRVVSDSGGHKETRYVIRTPIQVGESSWPIEITLTNRENMAFRMLLGREALRGRLLVDPEQSYLLGHPRPRLALKDADKGKEA